MEPGRQRRKLYVGPQVRRLRRDRGLTQGQMAAELGISPSYVNLIERNQRPVSADILIRLSSVYDLDLSHLATADSDALFGELAAAFADPIFKSAGASREDAFDLAAGNPVLGEAVAHLYRAWRTAQAELVEARAAGRAGQDADPVEEARAFLQTHRNHFPAIDEAAEAIARELGASGASLFDTLAQRFSGRHALRVRLLPDDVMTGAYRRLNRHAGELALSERLDNASRVFHLALQLSLIELQSVLDQTVNAARFTSDAGRRLSRAALANYAAAAILLPYEAFLKSAKALAYDIEALGRRFGASFEQVAHRLTTMQRPGAEGIAFFFVRVDAAGNMSKRYSGDVFPFARYGGSCPLWSIHETFRLPRRVLTQIIELPDGSRYFSIARTVQGGAGGFNAPSAERAVALGCRIEDAGALVYAKGVDLEHAGATPIGLTCRLCERINCAARAHPPLKRRLVIDEHNRLAAPFSFAFD
ncbi:MAG: short-chain fatty acyl-CoA regulator family protein [Parvularculaceae bacterium]|nr:short-chain fatty acyl-CoA regulator family protein [Parvularculaceae bacterium]